MANTSPPKCVEHGLFMEPWKAFEVIIWEMKMMWTWKAKKTKVVCVTIDPSSKYASKQLFAWFMIATQWHHHWPLNIHSKCGLFQKSDCTLSFHLLELFRQIFLLTQFFLCERIFDLLWRKQSYLTRLYSVGISILSNNRDSHHICAIAYWLEVHSMYFFPSANND